jgi:hypothetical protein
MYLQLLIKIYLWYVVDLLTVDETRYACYMDEVQTSRVLFYLRVMPTCITLIPAHIIRDKVAPVMFLYPLQPTLLFMSCYLFFLFGYLDI